MADGAHQQDLPKTVWIFSDMVNEMQLSGPELPFEYAEQMLGQANGLLASSGGDSPPGVACAVAVVHDAGILGSLFCEGKSGVDELLGAECARRWLE